MEERKYSFFNYKYESNEFLSLACFLVEDKSTLSDIELEVFKNWLSLNMQKWVKLLRT